MTEDIRIPNLAQVKVRCKLEPSLDYDTWTNLVVEVGQTFNLAFGQFSPTLTKVLFKFDKII